MINKENWAIEAEQVSFAYEGNKEKALDGLSLKIRRGEKVAFMGGNGSGKSTFFFCLNGIHRPDSGIIKLNGKPLSYTRKGLLEARSKVGIVFQEPDDQLFSASVYEEISFGILNLGAEREAAEKAVEQVIRELGITPFQDRPAHALSGGQKKQVAIADILVMHPEVMVLDEPAAALDPEHTKKVHDIIGRLSKKGITILMATHDIDYAYAWADEIVLLHKGKLLRQGSPAEICSDPELLEMAGLEVPSAVRIYDRLVEKGILEQGKTPPRNTEELLEMLD